MKNNLLERISRIGCITLLASLSGWAQGHQWAGRALDDFEWAIHEKVASLPSYGVFDKINFEVQDKTVTLTGQVVGERVKHSAERAIRRLNGVGSVVNRIEVLPSSRRDDALRMNLYRTLYEDETQEKSGAHRALPVHIIVKDGWATLEGVVASDADRGTIHLRALQVTAHLSDHLRVATEKE